MTDAKSDRKRDPIEEVNARVEAAVEAKKKTQRTFPASSFEEALAFARSILDFGSGTPVRRISLFDHLGKSPESGPSRQLVTNASKYGLITGNKSSDLLSLTPEGALAVDDEVPKREQAKARIKL